MLRKRRAVAMFAAPMIAHAMLIAQAVDVEPSLFFPILVLLVIGGIVVVVLTARSHRRHSMMTDVRVCRACGQSSPPFAQFCRRCGARL
jgi:ribosomal protein L40E